MERYFVSVPSRAFKNRKKDRKKKKKEKKKAAFVVKNFKKTVFLTFMGKNRKYLSKPSKTLKTH